MIRLRGAGTLLAAGLTVLASAGTAWVAIRSGSAAGPIEPGVGLAPAARAPAVPTAGVPRPAGPDAGAGRCPRGIVPMVQIQGARFRPALTGGTSFGVGHYTVTVRGRVANQTDATIELRSVEITLDGRPWRRTRAPARVPAQSVLPVTFEGGYESTRPHRVVVDSRLRWQWLSSALRSCGGQGLVDDD